MNWKIGNKVTQDIKDQVLGEARENFKKYNEFTPPEIPFGNDIVKVKYFICRFLDRKPLDEITPKDIEKFCDKSPKNIFELVNHTVVELMKDRVKEIGDG